MRHPPTLLTMPQFAEKHPAWTIGSLRWLRYKESENGFGPAFVTVGRRVLIDEAEFFSCIDQLNCRTGRPDSRC